MLAWLRHRAVVVLTLDRQEKGRKPVRAAEVPESGEDCPPL